jgi:type II pantothenate kinase
MKMQVAVDFGLTNIDVIANAGDNLLTFERQAERTATLPSERKVDENQLRRALAAIGAMPRDVERICVTGGQHRRLPDRMGSIPIVKVGEIEAIGRGGLYLARAADRAVQEALIVSAGSGTAMIAARQDAIYHVTGSAVGGGTLQGLAGLLLGTSDAREIDELARQGDSNRVDLTLVEATGGEIGALPADANAVNFGRVPSLLASGGSPDGIERADIASGLVVLVGQVIAVIAINAARAEKLEQIVVVGHLVDLPSVRHVLHTVAGYYSANIIVPDTPGYATAIGALLH